MSGKPTKKRTSGGYNPDKISPPDSANHFEVGRMAAGEIVINRVNVGGYKTKIGLSPRQALNLAAWLSVIADPSGEELPRLIGQIKKS